MSGILGCNYLCVESFKKAANTLQNSHYEAFTLKQIANNFFAKTHFSNYNINSNSSEVVVLDNILLLFTGEIYNKQELAKQEGIYLKNSTNEELISSLYKKYQEDFLGKLNGMFSFCLYDIKNNKFFCARDKYGKKPLFYYYKHNKFIFCSKINPIIALLQKTPKINKVALSQYLQYFVPLNENTFFQDIHKLEAASYVTIQNNQIKTKKYYKINTHKRVISEELALKDIEALLISSVQKRVKAQTEVGSLLSGGIDSSLISAIYTKISGKRVNTFSIGYSDYKAYSELDYSNIVAKHIDSRHHPLEISSKDFIGSFEEVLEILEQPHADSAAVPLFLLTKMVKKAGIKCVLSGEGSDEIFLGYSNYAKFLRYYEFEKSLTPKQNSFMNSIISSLQNNTKESEYLRRVIKKENLYNSFGEIFTDIQKKRLFKRVPNFKSETPKKAPIDWMSYIDLKIWLGQSLLSKVEKISTANSLAVRTPFLEPQLVDYMFSLSCSLKLGDTNKYLLKKIAAKYIPEEIINRTKKGFNSPFNEWIFNHYGNEILTLILEVNRQTDFFNEEYIKQIFYLAKQKKFKQHLWSLFIFSKWYKKTYC